MQLMMVFLFRLRLVSMLLGAGKIRDALSVWEDYNVGGSLIAEKEVQALMRLRKGGLSESEIESFPPPGHGGK